MGSLFGNRYGKIKANAPRNEGMHQIANQRISATIGAINQQFENALTVDGTDIAIWSKSESGQRCTCLNLKPKQSLFSDINPQPVTTYQTPPDVQSKPDNITFKIRGGKGKAHQRQDPDYLGTYDSVDPDSTKPFVQIAELDVHEQSLSNGTQELSDVLAMLDAGDDSGFLYGGDRTSCGICFGTGYVQGYDLLNGHRYILDASGTYTYDSLGFTLNRDNFPYSFESEYNSGHYVVWNNVELPTYFIAALSVHCRNNVKPAESLILELNFGQGWVTLTTDVLNARNGMASTASFRARPNADILEGTAQFTHIEFVYQYADNYRGQVPLETPSWSDVTKARALVTSTLSLSSKVPELKTFDIVFVAKTNSLYKVNDVTNFITSDRNNLGTNTAGIRLLQSYEITTLLRLAFNPVKTKSFTGLEQVQGDLLETYIKPTPIAAVAVPDPNAHKNLV